MRDGGGTWGSDPALVTPLTDRAATGGAPLQPTAPGDAAAVFFATQRWTAGVIGLGYTGLPLAVAAMSAGLRCIGFDVSSTVVDGLMDGRSHIGDVPDGQLRSALDAGLEVTSSAERLADADALIVCVPSPLGRNRQPDMSFIEAAAGVVERTVTPDTLVVLESTTYPGTTEELVLVAATATGLELDRDVFVAFSPERVDPGNALRTAEIPKVVGGVTPVSGRVAAAAYRRLVPAVHLVSSARTAELSKLLENIYRAVNIGLVNEIAQLAHQLDIDVWEVIDAAATKPFGFQAFYPGPGVGGHCIPLDPQFLAWRAREAKFATRFIDLADQVNTAMPDYTAGRIADLLNSTGRAIRRSRFLAVGVAYKPNVADDRESPAWDVLAGLADRGANISVFDPVIGADAVVARGYRAITDLTGAADRFDLAVVLTDHDCVDLHAVAPGVRRWCSTPAARTTAAGSPIPTSPRCERLIYSGRRPDCDAGTTFRTYERTLCSDLICSPLLRQSTLDHMRGVLYYSMACNSTAA
ncbi:nucleotide sugar dehydrogenase [soil metagenome]